MAHEAVPCAFTGAPPFLTYCTWSTAPSATPWRVTLSAVVLAIGPSGAVMIKVSCTSSEAPESGEVARSEGAARSGGPASVGEVAGWEQPIIRVRATAAAARMGEWRIG